MKTTHFTTTAPKSTTELVIQDAIIRRAWPFQETCAIELSCRRGLAVIFLPEENFTNLLLETCIETFQELEGLKIFALFEHNRVVGVSAR